MSTVPPFATVDDYNTAMSGSPDKFIAAAVAAIRNRCGWHVSPVATEEIVLDGPGGTVLYLPTLKLRSIVSIVDDGTPVDLGSVDFSRTGMIERRSGSWGRRMGSIKVTIEHGYDEVEELTSLAVTIAARAAASPKGIVQEGSDGVSIRFTTFGGGASGGVALLGHEKELIDRYTLPKGY